MFDSIHGRLTHAEPTRAVIEAAGIGYDIQVPLSTSDALPATGEEGRLLLHLVVRETEWRLYGFATVGEREVFRALLRVNGVGPTLALSLLSGLAPGEFRSAVSDGDVRALTCVKGVGKKTAERIVVELKDVVEKDLAGVTPVSPATSVAASRVVEDDVVDDAVRALTGLGLQAAEARRRVEAQLEILPAQDGSAEREPAIDLADLIRRALRG